MISNSFKTYISIVIIVLGFIAVFGLSNFLEQNRPKLPESYIDEDLSLQGEKLKGWSLGFEGLIADWYWVRSLQYIGFKVTNSKEKINIDNLQSLNPKLLYPFLDNATTLDPQFKAAYSYGAVVMPAIDKEKAIEITEKGIKNNPEYWRLYQHLGYIHWISKDYEKAAETYNKGSEIKGAPPFMRAMAAKMKNEGGSRETARQIYQQMYDEAEDSNVKNNAKTRLLELDSLNERDAVDKVLQTFKDKNKRCANNWREILPLLKNVKLPNNKEFRVDKSYNLVDPTDVPYLINSEKCVSQIDAKKSKIPYS